MFRGKAIIIGGGIGGLTTAVALLKAGINTEVYERAPQVHEVGAGLSLWSNAISALRLLGLDTEVIDQGAPFNVMHIYTPDGKKLRTTDFTPIHEKAGAISVGIRRASLQQALINALPKEIIHTDSDCIGIEENDDDVTVRFANGTSTQGALVIGADGIQSVVRRELFGTKEPRYAGYTCWRGTAVMRDSKLPTDTAWFLLGRGTQLGFFHCGRGQIFWFITQNSPANLKIPQREKKQAILSVEPQLHPMFREMINATNESAIYRDDIYDRLPIRQWGTSRVTLLGDAAHPTTPTFGQGACQAIEDAVVLADCLKSSEDLSEILKRYQNKRYRRTALLTNQSWWLGKAWQIENPVIVQMRNTITKWEWANRLNLKMVEKLLISSFG